MASDDEEGSTTVVELLQNTGLRAIPVGPLVRSRQLEHLGFLGIVLQGTLNTNFMTAWNWSCPEARRCRSGRRGFPHEAVVGVIDCIDSVGPAVSALIDWGIEEARIHILSGTEGRRRIESSQGPAAVLAQLIGFEHEHSERHLRELDAGHAVFLVEVEDKVTAERVSETLRENGGHYINYYRRWTGRTMVR